MRKLENSNIEVIYEEALPENHFELSQLSARKLYFKNMAATVAAVSAAQLLGITSLTAGLTCAAIGLINSTVPTLGLGVTAGSAVATLVTCGLAKSYSNKAANIKKHICNTNPLTEEGFIQGFNCTTASFLEKMKKYKEEILDLKNEFEFSEKEIEKCIEEKAKKIAQTSKEDNEVYTNHNPIFSFKHEKGHKIMMQRKLQGVKPQTNSLLEEEKEF